MSDTLRSSSIQMQTRSTSHDGHTPPVQGTPKAAGLNASQADSWCDAEQPHPWPMDTYERALNCKYSLYVKIVQF